MAASGSANDTAQTLRQRVGLNIKAARLAKGHTQSSLANEIGVNSGQVVSDWERGIASPSVENMAAVAIALSKDMGWFYGELQEAA